MLEETANILLLLTRGYEDREAITVMDAFGKNDLGTGIEMRGNQWKK